MLEEMYSLISAGKDNISCMVSVDISDGHAIVPH